MPSLMSGMLCVYAASGVANVIPSAAELMPGGASCSERSVADLVCSNMQRPSVAVLLGGSARILEAPLLFRSIRSHLIDAIGGDVTVFAALKVSDATGHHQQNANASIHEVMKAVQHIAGFSDELGARVLFSTTDTLPGDLSPPTCYGTPLNGSARSDKFASLTGQLNTRRALAKLLEEEETLRGERFDWVVLTRPDLAWYASILPHCFWNANVTWHLWDWVFVGTRDAAQRWLIELPQQFFGCELMSEDGFEESESIVDRVQGHVHFGSSGRSGAIADRLDAVAGSKVTGPAEVSRLHRFNASGMYFQAEEVLIGVKEAGPFADDQYRIPAMLVRRGQATSSVHPDQCRRGSQCARKGPMRMQGLPTSNDCVEKCEALCDNNECGGAYPMSV